jgi:hypothetical protein
MFGHSKQQPVPRGVDAAFTCLARRLLGDKLLIISVPDSDLTGRDYVTGLHETMIGGSADGRVFLGNHANFVSRQKISSKRSLLKGSVSDFSISYNQCVHTN